MFWPTNGKLLYGKLEMGVWRIKLFPWTRTGARPNNFIIHGLRSVLAEKVFTELFRYWFLFTLNCISKSMSTFNQVSIAVPHFCYQFSRIKLLLISKRHDRHHSLIHSSALTMFEIWQKKFVNSTSHICQTDTSVTLSHYKSPAPVWGATCCLLRGSSLTGVIAPLYREQTECTALYTCTVTLQASSVFARIIRDPIQ